MLIRAQQSLEEINREKRDDKDVEGKSIAPCQDTN